MACKKTRNEVYAGGFPPGMGEFEKLTDPRNSKPTRHHFGEILFIALAAMIGGMEGFDDIERFTKLKETWLRRILKLPHGPPSDDTFRRIFTALGSQGFRRILHHPRPLHPRRFWQTNSSQSTAKPCVTALIMAARKAVSTLVRLRNHPPLKTVSNARE
jgi:DDE_Tnp_1-associated